MKENIKPKFNKKSFLFTLILCFAIGTFAAYFVAREASGYVASMSFFIILVFCILPIFVITLIATIISAFLNNSKFTLIFLLSCMLIPASFFGSLKLMEAVGLARYKTSGLDEMRSIETNS